MYVRRYDIVPQQNPAGHGARRGSFPETATGLYLLKRAKHSNGEYMGDIVPLDQVRVLVDISPRFGHKAPSQLTSANSLQFSSEFWLNKYFNKELFFALTPI